MSSSPRLAGGWRHGDDHAVNADRYSRDLLYLPIKMAQGDRLLNFITKLAVSMRDSDFPNVLLV